MKNYSGSTDISRNIFLYKLISFFREFWFFVPVVVLFWQSRGLSMTEIYIIESFFAVFVILLEIPSGTFADRFGEKLTMVIAAISLIAGFIMYALSYTFIQFLIAEGILAIGISFLSGADSAFLYNSLKSVGRENDFKRIEGRAESLRFIGCGAGAFFGGFIASVHFEYSFYATALSVLVTFVLILFTKEPRHYTDVKKTHYMSILKESIIFLKKHKLIRWYIGFWALLSSMNLILWLYQPYFSLVGIELRFFGVVFLIYNIVAAIAGRLSHKIETFFGRSGLWIFFSVLFLLPFFTMPFFLGLFSVAFIFAHQFIRGAFSPIIKHKILEHTFENKRATVLSAGSFFGRMIKAFFGPFIGIMVDGLGILKSIQIVGFVFLPITILMLFKYYRIPKKYFEIKKK